MLMPRILAGTTVTLLLLTGTPVGAADIAGLTVAAADGQSDTESFRIGVRDYWERRWFTEGNWQVGGYWEAELGYWDSDKGGARHDSLAEISLTPVFRLESKNARAGGFSPYIEGGIGLHLLSNTSIGNRKLSTMVQIGSLVGAGFRFGEAGRYQVGYRYQHISNGSVKTPNDGMNLNEIRFGIDFP